MALGVLALVLLFDGGVSGGMRLAKLFLGDGIATVVALFGWLLC